MISSVQIEARDRRLSAIHEAGHVVVARHFGITGSAWIAPSGMTDRSDKRWIGRAQLHFRRPVSQIRRMMIAVAGVAAEEAWDARHDPELFNDLCVIDWPWWEDAFMSAADREAACWSGGDPPNKLIKAAMRTVELLTPRTGALWPEPLAEARELIVYQGGRDE